MISITTHAYAQAQKRVGHYTFKKLLSMAEEAWNSKEELPKAFTDSNDYMTKFGFSTYHYRYSQGFIWVYQMEKKPKLLTVYKYRTDYNQLNKPYGSSQRKKTRTKLERRQIRFEQFISQAINKRVRKTVQGEDV